VARLVGAGPPDGGVVRHGGAVQVARSGTLWCFRGLGGGRASATLGDVDERAGHALADLLEHGLARVSLKVNARVRRIMFGK
jgi:hypothetical protein